MGNQITSTLPRFVDTRLMDIAQMFGGIDYGDISRFANKVKEDVLKQIKKLVRQYEEEEGEDEKTVQTIIDLVLVVVGKKDPICIGRYSETIDNWGRQEASSKIDVIKKVLTRPKDFSDDMFFEGTSKNPGGFDIGELEGKVVKVGKHIIAVPFYQE